MSVETKHKNFLAYLSEWQICRDVFKGDKAMKANSARYIPPLAGETASSETYKNVINRETFENYTKATAKGMSGLIFSKNPTINLTPKVKALEENIDLERNNIIDIAQKVVNEVLEVGRCGLLIDMLSYDTTGMSLADVEKLNIRPYVKLYTTENIINWDTELINNQGETSLLVLQEVYQRKINTFEREDLIRYRVYTIEDGICICRVYESITQNKKASYQVVSESIPKMNGKALSFIPFVSFTAEDLTIEPSNPPLLDIANINVSHWYLSVERRNALHFVGFPSIYGVALDSKPNEEIKLGAGTINKFNNPNAKLEYLQLSADGLGSVEKAIEEKKQAMLALGARLLAPESSSQISENTMQMKTAGQRAVIIQVAETISRGMEKALNYMAMWLGDSEENEFKLNKDYNLSEMSPQLMTALFTGQQLGQIRQEDVFNALKKGEIIDESVTFEEFQSGLQIQSPIGN